MSHQKSVFIVDDHPLVREWLGALINQQPDMSISGESETAPDALSKIDVLKPDVVIVDITLSSGSGLELVKDIRRVSPESVSLVLSMHDELTYADRALRAGARGYVSKRDTTKKIITAIREVCAGRVFVSPEVQAQITERYLGNRSSLSDISALSDRELEVFRMLGQGQDTRQIADSLSISIKTVQVYCTRAREKLGLAGHHELMRDAIRWWEQQAAKQSA
ncbi:MAG: response regulator transcription factor [Verrucomicrobiaceae bacterium]|jgi:DNA-binding NarL/FixJ family response regulator|nr:response regulator transcription factor [Verrucomicrobiaceae bacterium]